LASYFARKNVPFVFRPINRLDRNTSGLVIVAKNKFSSALLTRAMKEKRIRKTYIAYLSGRLPDPEKTVEYMGMRLGVIDLPIHRTAESIIVREVCSPDAPDAEMALTYYRILRRCDECTEVEIFPQTGRTHQLRVHFSAIGHPILGDDMYGTPSDIIPRHALHASGLVIPLPSPIGEKPSERELTLSPPFPTDMEAVKQTFFCKG
jgi:23S rRNA pseudouridine1911/1915/1917 synthase